MNITYIAASDGFAVVWQPRTTRPPSLAASASIAAAPVGDDQYGEDPTTNQLQERVATLLGKEAALFFPSGTMTNQVAVRVLTRPGDEAIVSRESHLGWHETGGVAANSGVQLTEIGGRGVFTAANCSPPVPAGLSGNGGAKPTRVVAIGCSLASTSIATNGCGPYSSRENAVSPNGERLGCVKVSNQRSRSRVRPMPLSPRSRRCRLIA